jgi:anti-sigma28 factor (negative regulator of flagellin synthesis)
MIIQGNSPVESQEHHKVEEVDRSRDSEQRESSTRTDDSRDRVTISDEAREKKRESEMREERIDAARKADDSGGKDLDSMKVAKKVLDEM